jgi:hypothetical protein
MDMPLPFALLLIALGLALVMFGLYLFYAWLPFFYGLFGFEIGYFLGSRLWGPEWAWIIGGLVLGIVVAFAGQVLKPYRHVVTGYLGGSVIALALLSLDRSMGGIFVAAVAVCGGIAGALVARRFFDYFVIATTACGGAVLTSFAVQSLLSLSGTPSGAAVALLLTTGLAAVGLVFQFRHLQSWAPRHS